MFAGCSYQGLMDHLASKTGEYGQQYHPPLTALIFDIHGKAAQFVSVASLIVSSLLVDKIGSALGRLERLLAFVGGSFVFDVPGKSPVYQLKPCILIACMGLVLL